MIKDCDAVFSDAHDEKTGPRRVTGSCDLVRHGDKAMLWDTGLPAALKGREMIVVMKHSAMDGSPKVFPSCTLPLIGRNVTDMIITDHAVLQRPDHQSPFRLIELAPSVEAADVAERTTAHYEVALG